MNLDHSYEKEILSGLSRKHKAISPKFLYDQKGSEIFERICELEEYYPIHSETEILKLFSAEIVEQIGHDSIIIEPGCGSCEKIRYLLGAMKAAKAYVAMDISEEFIQKTAGKLQKEYQDVPVYTVAIDYTKEFTLPIEVNQMAGKRVAFFPGSTIGNMHPKDAVHLLRKMGRMVESGGGLLIGVDLKKDAKVLELAYDDPQGVTAEFNYNLLDRLNREFDASFDRRHFGYEATYNENKGRVEMFLVSQISQKVKVGGRTFNLSKDEMIHTEDSYKYSISEFESLAKSAGFNMKKTWTDQRKFFCVYYLERT